MNSKRDIEPCEHCGHVYTRGEADLTQREKDEDLAFLASDDPKPGIITSLAYSRIHEVMAAALSSKFVEPAPRLGTHGCWAVRAAYWGNPHTSPTVDDNFLSDHFEVRKAIWNRDFLADPVRDMLREEFA